MSDRAKVAGGTERDTVELVAAVIAMWIGATVPIFLIDDSMLGLMVSPFGAYVGVVMFGVADQFRRSLHARGGI